MKEYLYNKDFLPKRFVDNMNRNNKNADKRDSMIITIIALILLPISINNIKTNSKELVPVISDNYLEKTQNREGINTWIEIMDKCSEGNFTKQESNIYIYDKRNLEYILQDEKIVINTMEDLGENKYRLQIVKKENSK